MKHANNAHPSTMVTTDLIRAIVRDEIDRHAPPNARLVPVENRSAHYAWIGEVTVELDKRLRR